MASPCRSLGKGWDPADFFAFHLSVFSKFPLRISKENKHFSEHPYKVGQMRKCRHREAKGDLEAKLSALQHWLLPTPSNLGLGTQERRGSTPRVILGKSPPLL